MSVSSRRRHLMGAAAAGSGFHSISSIVTTAGATVAVTPPGVSGTIEVAVIGANGGATIAAPGGWTERFNVTALAGTDRSMGIWTRTSSGSTTSQTWTLTTTGDVYSQAAGCIVAYSAGSVVSSAFVTSNNDATPPSHSGTPSSASGDISVAAIQFSGTGSGISSLSPPSGYTQRGITANRLFAVADETLAAAVSIKDWAGVDDPANTYESVTGVVILRP